MEGNDGSAGLQEADSAQAMTKAFTPCSFWISCCLLACENVPDMQRG